jgi:hypothetical protein
LPLAVCRSSSSRAGRGRDAEDRVGSSRQQATDDLHGEVDVGRCRRSRRRTRARRHGRRTTRSRGTCPARRAARQSSAPRGDVRTRGDR